MKVCTSNIMDNPDLPRWKVRRAAAATARLCGVALFQEIGEKEDHQDIQSVMGKEWQWSGTDIAIPIAFKKSWWVLVDSGREVMHGGLAHTSPTRLISWVVLARRVRFRARAARRKVTCFMNTHFVSGAWNLKHKLNKDWRKEHWNLHWAKMQYRIMSFVSKGITVIFGGDFNRGAVPKFHKDQQWLVQHGIDKIGCVQGVKGNKVRVLRTGTQDVTMVHDHKATWAQLGITAA